MSERTSECSIGRERSEQSGVSEQVSSASERANRPACGSVLASLFLFVPDHSAVLPTISWCRDNTWCGDNTFVILDICSFTNLPA